MKLKAFFIIFNRLSMKLITQFFFGKSGIDFKFRVSEDIAFSARSDKSSDSATNSVVRNRMLFCDNIVSFEDFFILPNGFSDLRIKLK